MPMVFSTYRKPGIEGGLYFVCNFGAFMKYPKESLPKKTNQISDKKYGFFKQTKLF
jgi:hypothetical protein